jgi:PPK2 family polyphosphate:nucleotide phosphotransferase
MGRNGYALRVDPGEKVSLEKLRPDDTAGRSSRAEVEAEFLQLTSELQRLQQRLYAARSSSLLVVLQATDTAGKDAVIRKVLGPLDSRGFHVWSFNAPTEEEREHDFLWRLHAKTPRAGEIAVFNRSHYEDIVAVRLGKLLPKERWSRRYESINHFEQMLVQEGTTVLKIFLHISKAEQARRLRERLEDPARRWKFDPHDLKVREQWEEQHEAYEDVLERCSTDYAPWWVVPADRKWFRDLAVAQLLVRVLQQMDPQFPEPTWDWRSFKVQD